MTEELPWDIQAAIEIGGLFAYRWERREQEPILKEEVAAIIRKHSLPEGFAWQPIETAPKGKGFLLGWFPNQMQHVHIIYWDAGTITAVSVIKASRWATVTTTPQNPDQHPTHWQPLPEAPK